MLIFVIKIGDGHLFEHGHLLELILDTKLTGLIWQFLTNVQIIIIHYMYILYHISFGDSHGTPCLSDPSFQRKSLVQGMWYDILAVKDFSMGGGKGTKIHKA